jgi:hypothetical protein
MFSTHCINMKLFLLLFICCVSCELNKRFIGLQKLVEERAIEYFKNLNKTNICTHNVQRLESQSFKSYFIRKDFEYNVSILYIYSNFPQKDSCEVVKSEDHVYFTKQTFEEVLDFLFGTKYLHTTRFGSIHYTIVKHTEFRSFEHVSIRMKSNKINSVILTLKEYQYLLNNSSQILSDMELYK